MAKKYLSYAIYKIDQGLWQKADYYLRQAELYAQKVSFQKGLNYQKLLSYLVKANKTSDISLITGIEKSLHRVCQEADDPIYYYHAGQAATMLKQFDIALDWTATAKRLGSSFVAELGMFWALECEIFFALKDKKKFDIARRETERLMQQCNAAQRMSRLPVWVSHPTS